MKCDRYNKTVQDDAVWDDLMDARTTDARSGTRTYLTPTPVTVESDDEVNCLDDLR